VVARELLGKWLVRQTGDGVSAGMIVETEAYGGPDDRASHARAGMTRRTTPMFGPVGHAYVYLVYGMHECLNVTAHHRQPAGAVLLRALEPVAGIDLMRLRRARPAQHDVRLAAGPARLCQAMGVDRSFDGHDLTAGRDLWLARPATGRTPADDAVSAGPRVGVAYAGDDWSARPWRFWLHGNRSVSR
jgi:DNA-3-methyladenine glycosylase